MSATRLGISISSRAMFGSWTWYSPLRTAFDCGEGFSLNLLTRIFGVERIMLSHGHSDHIGGLATLVGLRAKIKGDTGKPLAVYYPSDSRQIDRLRQYIELSWSDLPYDLTWHPIGPGFTLQLDQIHRIEAFSMSHQRAATTLGYRIVEERKRLSRDYAGRIIVGKAADPAFNVGAFLGEARKRGEPVDELYSGVPFTYALDQWAMNPEDIRDASLAVMDCTFLSTADRDTEDKAHASLEESARLCKSVGVKHMLACHLSLRNDPRAVIARAAELAAELSMSITVCHPDHVLGL